MRFHKFLAVISLLLLPQVSEACWVMWYDFQQFTLYHIEPKYEANVELKGAANLREWQAMTSADIPLDDIEKVVYKMTLEEYETLCSLERYTGDNMFARWIKERDAAIMEFLLLAKRNERIRFQYNSLWYYPSMKVNGPTTLEEIIDKSLHCSDSRLRSRYMLQAMRAMFTLNRYDECLELWHKEFEQLPMDDAMRRHAYMYVAGSLYHTGKVDEALKIYAMAGDIDSIYYIAKLENIEISKVALIEMLYRNNPNNPKVFDRIKRIVREAENPLFLCGTKPHTLQSEARDLLSMAVRLGDEGRDAAVWYYTAAYLYYIEGSVEQAYANLTRAEQSNPSEYMGESLRTLRIIFDARYAKLDKRYEKQLVKDLRWLEDKSFGNLSTLDPNHHYDSWFYIFPDQGLCYWNMVTRYIINESLVPRYTEAGNAVRAMQLANYSSYYIFGGNPMIDVWVFDEYFDDWRTDRYYSLIDYRRDNSRKNDIDYSTFFFTYIDEADVDDVIAYVESVDTPKSELDRLLNRGSHLDKNFLYDIAGTHCLRNMRYAEAEEYLNKVDFYYSNHGLNVYLEYDPFELERVKTSSCDFRLNFARKMASLERAMERSTNQNTRARYMVDYAIALHNSFGRCWQLTHYHDGCVPHMYFSRWWYDDEVVVAAKAKARAMVNEAFALIDDSDLAAEIHYKFGNFKTVAKEYGYTKYGRIVKSQCDNLYDYHAERLENRY